MTHEEAIGLLAAYAIGALEEDVDQLRSHLAECDRCREELAGLLEVAAALGEAVEPRELPPDLRERVEAGFTRLQAQSRRRMSPAGPARPTVGPSPSRPSALSWPSALSRPSSRRRFALAAAAAALALVFVSVGLAAWAWTVEGRLRAARAELALNARGLALLTSTETSVVRLQPVAATGTRAHGHWYHRGGIDTQVLVIEFMPDLPPGEEYFGWLHYAKGTWSPAGSFRLDPNGYGRLILPGDDGSGVDSVSVTRQARPTSIPEETVVLHWPY